MTGPLIRIGDSLSPSEKKAAYREFWVEMYPPVAEIVLKSFANKETGMREPTQSEIRHRVEFCKKLVDELRKDHGWSKMRIKDNLAYVLRARLAGIHIDLAALGQRSTW